MHRYFLSQKEIELITRYRQLEGCDRERVLALIIALHNDVAESLRPVSLQVGPRPA